MEHEKTWIEGPQQVTITSEQILASPQLPTLPTVAVRLVDTMSNPDVEINDIAGLIKSDPALALQIIKSANSSLYGFSREVVSIESAIVLMGRSAVTALALSFTLVQSGETDGQQTELLDAFWLQSVTQAVAAESLAARLKGLDPGDLFLCGLLAEVGRLALLNAAPDEYAPLLAEATERGAPLHELELERFDFDHTTIGAELLRLWKLPPVVGRVAQLHHADLDTLQSLGESVEDRIVRAASIAAAASEFILSCDDFDAHRRFDHLAKTLLGWSGEELNDYINEVRVRADEVGQLFEIDTADLPDPMTIISRANQHLAELAIRSQKLAAVASSQNQALLNEKQELENENLTLQQQTIVDSLTNVHNRSFFDAFLKKELDRCRRQGKPIALLFCDIDHFKNLNDQHGHQFGDRVLQQVAASLQQSVRNSDIVARYGGEEFVILAVDALEDSLTQVAERVRGAVESLDIYDGDARVPVTVSVGVASIPRLPEAPDVAPLLIGAADAAMYESKHEGRNQVRFRNLGADCLAN